MKKKLASNQIPVPILSGGYSSDREMPASFVCLKEGDVTQAGGSKAVIFMSRSVEFSEITNLMSSSIASSFSVGVFANGFQNNYQEYIKSSSYSSVFYFYESVSLPSLSWQPPAYGEGVLSEYGYNIYAHDKDMFRSLCGDKYFSQFHYGGSLISSVKITFDDLNHKSLFDNYVAGKAIEATTVSKTLNGFGISTGIDGEVEVSAYQVGGDPSQLNAIFTNNAGGYYLSNCQITNVTACDSVISSMLKYASGSFADQMQIVNGKVVGNVIPVSFTFGDYATGLGLEVSPSIINQNITDARSNLTNELNKMVELRDDFAVQLTNSSSSNKDQIRQNLDDANYNINLLIYGDQQYSSSDCYFEPQNCVESSDHLIGELKEINLYNEGV